MALIETNLFGEKIDKVQRSIARLKAFEPEEGYYLAFSGGKDSIVVKALCDMAGVKYDSHYNATTVDPPEVVRFIIKEHPDVEIVKPALSMKRLIVKKQTPPTRISRYCCEQLKETKGDGRVTITGVRWHESVNRKNNHGIVTMLSKRNEILNTAEREGAKYEKTALGGVILNYDDNPSRRTVEMCYRTNRTLVNPIIDWTDDDVWEFIRIFRIPYCGLYDDGLKRIGCIGCPLGGFASMRYELARWPTYRKLYVRAFDEMLVERKNNGKDDSTGLWTSGENVMLWWTGELQASDPNQMKMTDFTK